MIARAALVTIASIAALSLGNAHAAEVQAAPDRRVIKSVEPRSPEGAPNVVVVLLDDVGFAASSVFGGPIPTPTYAALAAQGLRYNRFHTTAMCSPTRAALLTGRNHHRVGMGTIVNLAYGEPSYTSVLPTSAATIGRVLQLNGYSTAWFGKNHVTPMWEITPVGPFDRWPNALGFDYFYGFMDGATDQWAPDLVENRQFVEPPATPDYILDKDLADHAVGWLRQQHTVSPAKPFFLYYVPATAHEPHQAPAASIEKFTGKFAAGWDAVRRQTFERQKRMGLVPADTVLTPRPASIPSWDSLSKQEQEVAARMMEVFAAQLAYFDEQFSRVVAEIKRSGRWDNTLVLYIDGDNGSSGEGTLHGRFTGGLNFPEMSVEYMHAQLDHMGGPDSFENYQVGWAWAMGTPFQWTKQIASHLGGLRDGLVVTWPNRIRDRGGLRSQFLHVTDIAPTIYEAAGITSPQQVDGVAQMSFDGVSFLYTFDQPQAPSRHRSQYFEMLGNRAFYQDGWMASTTPPRLPWERKPAPRPDQYEWELYDLESDFSQGRNLAKEHPKKLAELQAAFDAAAKDNGVLPLDNDAMARGANQQLRPYATNGRDSFEYFRGEQRLPNASFPNVLNRAWTLSVRATLSESNTSGTLITQGGQVCGWGLFLFDGRPNFVYRASALPGQTWTVNGAEPLSAGEHVLRVQVTPDSNARGAGATVVLTVDDRPSMTARLAATIPNWMPTEGVGVGRDFGTPLLDSYSLPFRFPGEMGPVKIELPSNSNARVQQ